MERPQRWISAWVERRGLLPHVPFAGAPISALDDNDLGEASSDQPRFEVDPT
ncbi:MAG TPA: hypothetical protein VES02_12955 [Dermatophilaceae bacterium]|nr:hypothetical protein [Dermatophilaceae bacterium]